MEGRVWLSETSVCMPTETVTRSVIIETSMVEEVAITGSVDLRHYDYEFKGK